MPTLQASLQQVLFDSNHLGIPPVRPKPRQQSELEASRVGGEKRPHLQIILETLRSDSIGDQLRAAETLHKMLARGADARLPAELREAGALELLSHLVMAPNVLLRQEALHTLWFLSADPANALLLAEMPSALNALVGQLPSRPKRGHIVARRERDETGETEASRVKILAPAVVALLRNISLHDSALPRIVNAGACSALIRLLLGAELEGSALVDVLLVLWKLSAALGEGENMAVVGSGAARRPRYVGPAGLTGSDKGAEDVGIADGASAAAGRGGHSAVNAPPIEHAAVRADEMDGVGAAQPSLQAAIAAATESALSELRRDSVLGRLAALSVRTAVGAEAAAAESRKRAGLSAERSSLSPAAADAAIDGEGEGEEPSTANAIISALLCNLATTQEVAERSGALGAIDGVCWSLRASFAPDGLTADGVGPSAVSRSQLHAVWALANLLSLSSANCRSFLHDELQLLPALAQLVHYREPAQRLLKLEDAVQLQTRNRARYKAVVVVRCVAREAVRGGMGTAALRLPALVTNLVDLLVHRATSASHSLALFALADLAGGLDAPELAPGTPQAARNASAEDEPLAGARQLVAAGALERLRFTLLSADREVLDGSTRLLCVLSALPEAAAQLVPASAAEMSARMAGGPLMLDTLLTLLTRGVHDRRLVRQVLRALRTLLLNSVTLRAVVGSRRGAVDALLHLTASADERTQLWATSALHMLVRASETGAVNVRECGGVAVLLKLLSPTLPPELRSQAAQALDEMCQGSEQAAVLVDKADGCVQLADAISALYTDYRTPPFF